MATAIAELMVNIGANTDDALKGLGGLNKSLDSFGSTAKAALPASAALAGVGAGIAAGFAQGVSSAGDLEQAVANISTIKPEIDSSAVFTALNDMTTRVPQSADQLGAALYDVFSSIDVSQADALVLVEKFAKGAVGAQTDAKTFGTSVIGVMNAYGLSVDDASHISDVFFNTVKNGVVTGAELAGSLGPVTQAAKSAGVDLDTLGGLIAGVTKEGGPAAQNINNLNNLLAKLNSKEAVKGFEALGVSLVDDAGNFRPILSIFTDAKAKLDALAPAARNAAIQNIFQDFQARQGFTTILSQLDFVKKAVDENAHTAGAAASAYTTMAGTFKSQTALMGNSFTALLTTVGGKLIPTIEKITGFVNGLVSGFAKLPEPVQTGIALFLGIAGALAGILGTIGLVAFGITSLGTSFIALGGLFGLTSAGMLALLGPIGLIIAAVALLGIAWATNFGDIQGKTAAAIGWITENLGTILVALAPLTLGLSLFGAAWVNNWGGIREKTQAAIDLIGGALSALPGLVQAAWIGVQPTLAALGDLFGALGNLAGALGTRIGTGLVEAFTTVSNFLSGPLTAAFQGVMGFLQGVFDLLGKVMGALGVPAIQSLIGAGAGGIDVAGAISAASAGVNEAAAAVRGGGAVTATVNLGGVTVTGQGDEQRLADAIINQMTDLLSGAESRTTPPQPAFGGGSF
jgi:TP901 family phage tail tape measure protein